MNKKIEPAGSRQKPASILIAEYCLGQTKGKMPLVDWSRVDGNIFSILATAGNAWKRVDVEVTQRIREVTDIAMRGTSEDQALAGIIKALKEADDGYSEILQGMMQLTDGEEDESEDDDLGGLEEDFPDEDEDEDEDN